MTEKTDRSFSNGQPVDSIETEKSRIVLRELEKGWWILAVSKLHVYETADVMLTILSLSILHDYHHSPNQVQHRRRKARMQQKPSSRSNTHPAKSVHLHFSWSSCNKHITSSASTTVLPSAISGYACQETDFAARWTASGHASLVAGTSYFTAIPPLTSSAASKSPVVASWALAWARRNGAVVNGTCWKI